MVVYIQDISVVRKCTACWLSTGGGKACTQMSCSSAKSCPECAVVTGRGRPAKPLLSPIPVQSSFQIFGVDLIELPALLAKEAIPLCGDPEALQSDRGTNLVVTPDAYAVSCPGIKKLNTTAYHMQCDGIVQRFNRTLKTALSKYAAKFGN